MYAATYGDLLSITAGRNASAFAAAVKAFPTAVANAATEVEGSTTAWVYALRWGRAKALLQSAMQ